MDLNKAPPTKTSSISKSPRSPLLQDNGDEIEDDTMLELGYVQNYRRVFRSIGNLCLVISLTSPLSAILITGFYQITYGGYWGLSWGWIIPNVITFAEVLAISELASSMPVNGSFYWWAGALAPPRWSNPISYITGWVNILSAFSGTAAFAYAVATSFAYSVTIAVPSMTWTNPQLMALSMGIIVLWAALMTVKLEQISVIYGAMATIVLVQTLLFIFGLPITHAVQKTPFASGKQVFGEFTTWTDWGTAVAVPYSWFAAMWVNSAWMLPVYLAEETHRASIEIPKSLILTYSMTAVVGLLVCLISAFCITDIEAAALDESGYPLFDLVISHWGEGISAAFFLVVTPVGFIGGSGTLLTYASQIAAFARDGGFPYSEKLAYVHPRLNLPIYSIAMLAAGTFLILLFALSEEASSIIYSLSVVAGLITFIIPVFLRIFPGDRWIPGPFNLGRWSIPVHTFTVISQLYIIVMECFPPYRQWTWSTMNYNFAVTSGAILVSSLLYQFVGKENYKGLNTEVLAARRREHGVRTH